MPRNGSGTFTLVSGNPVVTGTTIESNWANTTLSDIATTLTDSLSRSGQGGMTAALRIADGSQGAPGVGFANETGSGFYRAGTGEVWAVVQGSQTLNLDANGVYVPADKTTTVDGAFVFNEAGADKDARFEGDTDANLLFTDASTDRVGIGTNTPTAKLDVSGDSSLNGAVVINEAGADKDTRIEGDTDANLVFVDASTDRVGVGINTPATKLNVRGATQAKEVAVQWERSTDGAVAGGLGYFYDAENSVAVGSVTNHPLKLIVNDATQATLTSTGLGIGTSSPDQKLTVSGNARLSGSMFVAAANGVFFNGNNAYNTGILSDALGTSLRFYSGAAATNMTLDSSGNLGLGVTPSAWTRKAMQMDAGGTAGYYAVSNGTAVFSSNVYYGSGDKYVNTNYAGYYAINPAIGAHVWATAPSGTAGNAISFTEAMTLDASGRLGVGATDPDAPVTIQANSGANAIRIRGRATGNLSYLVFRNNANSADLGVIGSGDTGITFDYGGSERARITSGGDLLVGTTANPDSSRVHITGGSVTHSGTQLNARPGASTNYEFVNRNGAGFDFYVNSAATFAARITSGGDFLVNTTGAGGKVYVVSDLTANNGLRVDVPASFTSNAIAAISATAAGTGWNFFYGESSGGSSRIQIRGDGNVYNANGTYGTISDVRLKQDIVDAGSQWSDIKAIRFRKYRMKSDVEADPNAPVLLGVVAQELEQVCPGLVDDGEIKTVKSSVLLMKAAVALQEAMTRIEQLEARVAALEAQP